MSIIIENSIPAEQRFTQKDGVEFHVFSCEITDATVVNNWVVVEAPYKVLIESESVARLKNRRIEWQFDEDKTITAVEIKDES